MMLLYLIPNIVVHDYDPDFGVLLFYQPAHVHPKDITLKWEFISWIAFGLVKVDKSLKVSKSQFAVFNISQEY